MAAKEDTSADRRLASSSDLDEATRRRLERDWTLPMSERLGRMHVLCKQMTAIAGSARRK